MKLYQGMTYLLAAGTQSVVLLLLAWLISKWLDKAYPQGEHWDLIAYAVAGIIILSVWAIFLKNLSKEDPKKRVT